MTVKKSTVALRAKANQPKLPTTQAAPKWMAQPNHNAPRKPRKR